jgi:hypothetical protein
MPRHFTAYEPDQIDLNTMLTALGEDFGMHCVLQVEIARDVVITTAKCYKYASDPDDGPQVVARHKVALRGQKSAWVGLYACALDCWHQLDRGLLGAAQTPIIRGWNGRPQRPRARHAN